MAVLVRLFSLKFMGGVEGGGAVLAIFVLFCVVGFLRFFFFFFFFLRMWPPSALP